MKVTAAFVAFIVVFMLCAGCSGTGQSPTNQAADGLSEYVQRESVRQWFEFTNGSLDGITEAIENGDTNTIHELGVKAADYQGSLNKETGIPPSASDLHERVVNEADDTVDFLIDAFDAALAVKQGNESELSDALDKALEGMQAVYDDRKEINEMLESNQQ